MRKKMKKTKLSINKDAVIKVDTAKNEKARTASGKVKAIWTSAEEWKFWAEDCEKFRELT